MKYKEWVEIWLENYVKMSSKDRTYDLYKILSEKHVVPKFGEFEIDSITPIEVQKFITELLQRGNLKKGTPLSKNSVNSIISVIQNSLKTANLLGVAEKYEMNKIKRPNHVESTVSCFNKEEQKKIEEAVLLDKRNKMKGIILCLYTGMRLGELLSLEWDDVDFANKELQVNKSCHDGRNEQGVFTRITGTPKTTTSIRMIPIPKQLIPLLRQMKKDTTDQFVVSEKNKIISNRSYQRSFELLLKKLKIKHRGIHSLRHTFATRALECGMDVKTLSEVLGHKNPTITLQRYVHSLPEHKHEMMNRLGKIFS